MFRKSRITGKIKKGFILFIAMVLMLSFPFYKAEAAAADRFIDVNPAEWYAGWVSLAVDAGFFAGTSTYRFSPKDPISRASFVLALANLCRANLDAYNAIPFKDVAKNYWGYQGIAWAYANGIAGGISEDQFAPERQITRQEMCVMLVSTIEKIFKVTLSSTNKVEFSDYNQIAPWAQAAVKKCVANDLIAGSGGKFNPNGIADRAQGATVIGNYYQRYRYKPLLEVSGFYLHFRADQYYYICTNAEFDDCRILKYTGSGKIENLQVEHDKTGVKPYSKKAYKLGDKLNLGKGRAKLTFNIGKKTYTIMMTDPDDANWTKSLARITGSVNLRKGASTSYDVINVLPKNSWVYHYEKKRNSKGEDWYRVKVASTGQIGYVHADYVNPTCYPQVGMPARYKAKINALKKAHPNWKFTFVNVGVNYIEAFLKYGASETYVDPINYLNEEKIFAFLDVRAYKFGYWTEGQVADIWIAKSGSSITERQAIEHAIKGSKTALMNPLYIACRAGLEGGYATSAYAKGKSVAKNVTVDGVKYESYPLGATYYNFYGIGARDKMPDYSMIKAKEYGWNSKDRAFLEGAAWIKDEYLDWGDATPYFFRYAYKTQYAYMTDPEAPLKEAKILKKAYSDPKAQAHFIIPVYNNMPS